MTDEIRPDTPDNVVPPDKVVPQLVKGSSTPRLNVSRQVYNEDEFDRGFTATRKSRTSIFKLQFAISLSCLWKGIKAHVPVLHWLPRYGIRSNLRGDLIGGCTVGVMHIPQDMAYAMLAGLPPVYGLYSGFVTPLIYFLFGTSRHISLGGIAVVSMMYGTTVNSLVPDPSQVSGESNNITTQTSYTTEYISCVMTLSFLAGLIQIGLGVLQLGFIGEYFSDPLVKGFTTAVAVYVAVSQIKSVLGITIQMRGNTFGLPLTIIDIAKKVPEANITSVIISVIAMPTILTVKLLNIRFKKHIPIPIPIELIALIVGTMVSHFFNFNERYGVPIVGYIPTGLPIPQLPSSKFLSSVGEAFPIAVVAFAIGLSMSKTFSKKQKYSVDANQELLALGLCGTIGSLLSCYTPSASPSRSVVQEDVGGRTQVVSIISSSIILIMLLAAGPLFYSLPTSILASIVIVALRGLLLQCRVLPRLWRISLYDFSIYIVTCLATLLLSPTIGLLIGLSFSLFTVIVRIQRPSCSLLGRLPHTDLYRDILYYDMANQINGVKIFRMNMSLCFINVEHFIVSLYKFTGFNPALLLKQQLTQVKITNTVETPSSGWSMNRLFRRRPPTPTIAIDSSSCYSNSSFVDTENEVSTSPNRNVDNNSAKAPPVIRVIILDCESFNFVDSVGVSTLEQLFLECRSVGVRLYLAKCRHKIRSMLKSTGFFDTCPKDQVFLSVHDAVLQAVSEDPELTAELSDIGTNPTNMSTVISTQL